MRSGRTWIKVKSVQESQKAKDRGYYVGRPSGGEQWAKSRITWPPPPMGNGAHTLLGRVAVRISIASRHAYDRDAVANLTTGQSMTRPTCTCTKEKGLLFLLEKGFRTFKLFQSCYHGFQFMYSIQYSIRKICSRRYYSYTVL